MKSPLLPPKAPERMLSKAGLLQLQWSPDVRLLIKLSEQPISRWYHHQLTPEDWDTDKTQSALQWMQLHYGIQFNMQLCQQILESQKAKLSQETLKLIQDQTIDRIFLDPETQAITYRLSDKLSFVVNFEADISYAQFEADNKIHQVALKDWQIVQSNLMYQTAKRDPKHFETVLSDLMSLTSSF